MQNQKFILAVEHLVAVSTATWLALFCEGLRKLPSTTNADCVLKALPVTSNTKLSGLATEVIQLASQNMSWEALGHVLESTHSLYQKFQEKQELEILWSGPSPLNQIPARRIDQALYDQISAANSEILLITFAAGKIERLASELLKAAQRGVRIRLILEFEFSSEGQLSFDALKAFPGDLISLAEVYHWPTNKRGRNKSGRPSKLHAKVAIIDNHVIISSANLTDDAFSRNFEIGSRISDKEFKRNLENYIESLINNKTLVKI